MNQPMPDELLQARKTTAYESMCRYAVLTNDPNPLHIDREFAAKTPMGGIIAHGTMSLSLIWRSLRTTLGRDAVARTELAVRFVRPVREGDTVTAGGKRRQDTPDTYDVWILNQNGEAVIQGTARVPLLS